jgi:A/G-specific adenine glycosylase
VQLAESLLPSREIEAYTQGLMDLGSMVCTRRKPRCNACPLKHRCVALQHGVQERIPGPRPTKALPLREVVMPIIMHAGEIMLEKRPPMGIWGGLWCLPEFERFADMRTIVEKRYGVRVLASRPLEPIAHGFTHFKLNIYPVIVEVEPVISVARSPGQLWVTPEDAINAAVPAPVRKILRELIRHSVAA